MDRHSFCAFAGSDPSLDDGWCYKSALMIPKPWRGTTALLPKVNYRSNPYEVARDAHALLVLTEWEEFRQLERERIYDMMARPLVIDGRKLLDPAFMREMGFEYHGFGCRLEDSVSVRLPAHAAKASSMDAPLPLVRPKTVCAAEEATAASRR
jgi:UDP-glucose/GDP-mannose dehydrogenase family, UDP binding domain